MNCYKFEKDGIKHTLVQIREEKGAIGIGESRALLMSRKQFLKQVKDSEVGYAMIKKARAVLLDMEIIDLPIEIQRMLEEFADKVVDDLPDKLPPSEALVTTLILY